jgi:adenylate cyclase
VSALPLPITTRLSLSDEADPLTLLELVSEELSGSAVINDALQRVTEHLVEQFPKVQRACFLLGSEMLLVAHHPGDSRPSTQLSEQAMLRREAFTWPPVLQPGLTQAGPALGPTQWHYQVGAALYAPLLIGGKALGCLCAENSLPDAPFSSEDLRLMRAVAAQAALALDRGLLRTQVERTEEVLENFQKLVPTQIGSRLRQHRGRIRPGGEFCEVTVMFADVRGFTQLSSSMRADEITEMIGIYFDRLVPVLSAHHGMVDKYVGDAIMAIFGSPDADPEHALHAVQAALQMQAAVSQLNQQRRTSGETLWEVGIGIHCGEALHGFSGTRERMEFTVIGNTVNRASRFCDGARGGEVLISPEVHQRVWRGLRNQIEAIRTSIPTKHEGDIQAYQVMPVQRVTP